MKNSLFASLQKKRVAIDLGSSLVKVIAGSTRKKGVQTDFAELIDLVSEYKMGSSDEITDDVYTECLKKLVWRYNFKEAAVTLPANEAIIQSMTFSTNTSEEEMLEAIQEEIASQTFDDIDDLQIACCELDSHKNSDKSIDLLACAVPKSLIDRYKSIFKYSGLKPTLFDLDILAIYNCFYYSTGKLLQRPAILLHCGAEFSYCIILHKKRQPFFRILSTGGNHIVTRLMQETELKLNEAENYKRMFLSDLIKYDNSLENLSIVEIYCEFAAQLIGEMRRCLQHYQVAEGITEFDSIHITGGEARNTLLANLINHDLNIKTQVWNPMKQLQIHRAKHDTSDDDKIGLHMASAIGALVHGE
ncbi:MAG: hypothetical protein DWQ05_18820 [Calditrichaeota bacterium]|nr:MAG: hypothetical protein DWQ05_18820 [Calditrichota bacterium]